MTKLFNRIAIVGTLACMVLGLPGCSQCQEPPPVDPTQFQGNEALDQQVGQVITIRGTLERSKIPRVNGVLISEGHIPSDDLFNHQVECTGQLHRFVIYPQDPDGPFIAQLSPGVYYELVDHGDEPIIVKAIE
ncbi:MAG: hypothetical protein KTR15_13210 [Phycisphaeraceae bacterium]|nr:hypothetical protein [Phycisphaeraceae bacterium]